MFLKNFLFIIMNLFIFFIKYIKHIFCFRLSFIFKKENFIFIFFDFFNNIYEFLKFLFFEFNINFFLIKNYVVKVGSRLILLENSYFYINKNILFWFIIFLVGIFLGFLIIYSRNAVYSLLFLISIYVYSSILLILFNLEFFGLLYTIIYVGAIAVLFLFIIMMLKFEKVYYSTKLIKNKYLFIFCFIILFFLYLNFYNNNILHLKYYYYINLKFFSNYYFQEIPSILNQNSIFFKMFKLKSWSDDILDFSLVFYTHFYYIFLLVGIILLISIVAPIILTYKERFNMKINKASLQVYKKKSKSIFIKDY